MQSREYDGMTISTVLINQQVRKRKRERDEGVAVGDEESEQTLSTVLWTTQLSADIEQSAKTLSCHKALLLEEINKLGKEFTQANDTYKRFVSETEEKATQSLNKAHS